MRTVLYLIIGLVLQQIISAQSDYLYQIGKKDSVYSNILKESRDIYVQLPYSYNANSKEKYPVIYILDGDVLLPTVVNIHDFYSGGFMPDMIMIGIDNSQNRTRDLTTSKVTSRRGMPYKQENGEAKHFLSFIKTELIPYIESKYPVTNYRTLIGHSYAGLFTIYTLLNKPELFTNYISIDPSLDWDNQKILKQAKADFLNINFNGKGLFMSLGGQLHMQDSSVTLDNIMQDGSEYTMFARSNIELDQFIDENESIGLNYEWKFYSNDLHGTIPQPSIKDGLISLFEWYQMENTYAINNPETSVNELIRIIENREAKLKAHFGYSVAPYPQDLLNMSGYMNMEMGQPDKSKMYFEKAIQYYPESANLYDSMADYYISLNDYDSALKFVTKAYELSNDDYHKTRIEKFKEKL